MHNVVAIIKALNIEGVFLSVRNDKLLTQVRKGKLTDEIQQTIRQNRDALIAFLKKRMYPLSYAQERLWFIDQYERNAVYNMPGAIRLFGKLNVTALKQTLSTIIVRHEVLRTNFVLINDVARQVIHEESQFELVVTNFSHFSREEAEVQVSTSITTQSQLPFDLENESLIRVTLFQVNEQESVLFMNMHHIVSDGWSFSILFKELSVLYETFAAGKDSPLPEPPIQYADYAVWQREYLQGEVLEQQSGYWKSKLAGVAVLELPTDRIRTGDQTFNGDSLSLDIDKTVSLKLEALSKDYGVTLFMSLLSIFKVLLHKYSGQEDICVGSPIANRTRSEVEGLIGFFVNTLALRDHVDPEARFTDLLAKVKTTTLDAYSNQDLPFERVVNIVETERNLSYSPLFQVAMVLQNNPKSKLESSGLTLSPVDIASSVAKFDLMLEFTETSEGLAGRIEYNTDLFNRDTIVRMAGHFIALASSVTANPDTQIKDLVLLTPAERNQLLSIFNDTYYPYRKDVCVHELFEEQVLRSPDAVAVEFGDEFLTYRELNERANQLGHHLCEKGVKAETLVGVFLERSIDMIVSLYGIMKAGGAYVPIDPFYPADRISYILEDSSCKLLLVHNDLKDQLPLTGIPELICLDDAETKAILAEQSSSNIPSTVQPDNLIYVIYTSGSTGRPKGTLIEHRALVNRLDWMQRSYPVNEHDTLLQKTTYTFDVSVWELFWWSLYGARLCLLAPGAEKDPEAIVNTIARHSVSTVHFVPSMYGVFLDYVNAGKHYRQLRSLRQVFMSGEALAGSHVAQSEALMLENDTHLINLYGPTEATIDVSYYNCNPSDRVIPIGKPVSNTQLYIVDQHNNIVPIGVSGELCIAGDGLARGYLNKAALTAEKFIRNMFSTDPESKLYKTGDLARFRQDGNIEYLGRLDNQVKIRGFRIELGEIEHVLAQIEGIKQCCVTAKERKTASGIHKYLVAYYVQENGEYTFTDIILRDKLLQTLPEYMVPDVLMNLDALPVTMNGKLDRRALPEPNFSSSPEQHVLPATELELKLCQVYVDVLGLDSGQISTQQSFFKMGGNSILSIQLKQKLNQIKEFKHISIPDLFKYDTIDKLIQSIKQDNETTYKLQLNAERNTGKHHEIAIIGTSGAFSGVDDIDEFWQLIVNQKEGIEFYSHEACKVLGVNDQLLQDPNYIPVAGNVKDIDRFDPSFWDISLNEAKQLDPQIRKFIEHCWFTLEKAGYAQQRKAHHIGVFAGSGNSYYFFENILNGELAGSLNLWEATNANTKDALATKAAYMLDLSGPAISINTACSTGLVSVIEACKNLQLGTCDMALSGGVSFALPGQVGYVYHEGMILSKDGHCRTFDKDASGTTRGSGVGVVLLKRLDDAIRDNDNILGVIKGYASNNDGARKTSYTAPSVVGQAECIINAQQMAGISPDQINYIECHGTATNLGDQIELQALAEAFEYQNNTAVWQGRKIVLGAVKANIGHADAAAGIAGLIKVCAMFEHNMIPGQVNFNEVNPGMNLDGTNFEIAAGNKDWLPDADRQRVAGISSFGVGGTNAHLIIGDYISKLSDHVLVAPDAVLMEDTGEQQHYIVPVSAKNRSSLEFYKQRLIGYLTNLNNNAVSIRDIAYTFQEKRVHFNYRTAFRAKDIDELTAKLKLDTTYITANTSSDAKVVLMFPGQGTQYTNMCKALYDSDSVFRKTIDHCIILANKYLDIDLLGVLYPLDGQVEYNIDETRWTQIALFCTEYALAKCLESIEIKADAYIGHSVGEYVAATLCGVFSLEDAIKVVIARGSLMQAMQPGTMLAVNAGAAAVETTVSQYHCEIAAVNSPDNIVVSGDCTDIELLNEQLRNQAIPTVSLNTTHAFHSRMMEAAVTEFAEVFKGIRLGKPGSLFISNLTGNAAGDEVATPVYWCSQLRNTVQFAKGIDHLSSQYRHQVNFIEVGTGKGLSSFVNKYKMVNGHELIHSIPLLPSAKEAKASEINSRSIVRLEDIKAKLWMLGVVDKPNETILFGQAKLLTSIPTYQFNYQKCWIEKADGLVNFANKGQLIDRFKNEISDLSDFTKADAVSLLEKLLSSSAPEKLTHNEPIYQVKLIEDHYTDTEYQIAQIFAEVLGAAEFSVNDDFFKLGGHSLLATQVLSKIKLVFNNELSLRIFFENSTIKTLSALISSNEFSNVNLGKITAQPRPENLPLSYAQERLWFIDQYERNAVYNLPGAVRLLGKLNVPALAQTLSAIIARHEILRTNFVVINDIARQVIHEQSQAELGILNLSHLSREEAEIQALSNITTQSQLPFDLEGECLIRGSLYQIDEQEAILFMNMHHIIADGWSFSVLFKELSILYEAFAAGNESPLRALPIQYADYAIWQREYLQGEVLQQQLAYWKSKLAGLSVLELPADRIRPSDQTFNGDSLPLHLGKEISLKLEALSNAHGVTLFMSLLSIFKVLLSKYSGQEDICVGSPIANRTRSEVEGLIGFFVNTLALRDHIDPEERFETLLAKVKTTTLEAYDHQDLPFEQVVEVAGQKRSLSYSPLFQVMMILQNNDGSGLNFSGLRLSPIDVTPSVAKFDLTLEFTETADGLVGRMEYNTDLFNRDTIARMAEHFMILAASVTTDPGQQIKDLVLLSSAERHQLLSTFNDTYYPYRKDICIHELFEEQVLRSPDAVAVEFGDESLTYSELNEKANQLGHYLREKGVKAETLVGVFVERSIDMIISLYGIMKAGGAYVPIDPFYPEERSSYILEDSGCTLLLTHRYLKDRLPVTGVPELVCLDDVQVGTALAAQSKHNILSVVQPVNLAYVIYTSGSTGRPKGTLIEHRSLVNKLNWRQRSYPVNEQDTLLQKTTYTFDVSVWELFWWSLYGARLCILAPGAEKDPEAIVSTIARYSVSTIHFVPSMYSVFLDYVNTGKHHGQLRSLRQIFTSGEALAGNHVAQSEVLMLENGTQLINLYGPTEATIEVSYYDCKPSDRVIPIGKPISNTQLYIVDPYNQVVPIGVAGELCIAGDGLARGYLNREDLTAEKFVRNVFSTESGSLLYKTGDLARFRSDGNIEYLGRLDNQVKIRGFRIELGEIEQVLSEQPELISNVVVAGKDKQGNNRLIAYVVAGEDAVLDVESLRKGLLKRLPEYMLPNLFIKLESMPLTASGKIDRKALPEAELNIETTQAYVAPESETEQKLALIWQEVLGLEKVGIHHNFFELGGHSLLATQVVSKVNKKLGLEIRVPVLFQQPTIRLFALYLEQHQHVEWTPLVPVSAHREREAIYVVPGQACDVTSIQYLSKYLESNYAIYGFQYAGMDYDTQALDSVEAIATQNIAALKKIQPEGPYILCGYSFGGYIAFEMAKQLQENGDRIKSLCLLDTASPEHFNRHRKSEAEGLLFFIESIENLYGINIGLTLAQLENISRLDFYNAFEEAGKKYQRKELLLDFEIFNRRVETNSIHSAIRYNPVKKPYNIPITLFRAQDHYDAENPTLGWSVYSSFDINIKIVTGNHHTMMLEPHAKVLGACINSHITIDEPQVETFL